MVEIVVSGDFETVLQCLLEMKAVCDYRKSAGWTLFQDDEEWIYETERDDRVCPICREYGLKRYFHGPIIPMEFPSRIISISKTEIYPAVHQSRPWLWGLCRCWMWWRDVGLTLTERLGNELFAVI